MGKWANGQMGKWANGQMGKSTPLTAQVMKIYTSLQYFCHHKIFSQRLVFDQRRFEF